MPKNGNATEIGKNVIQFFGQILEYVIAFYQFDWHICFLALFLSIHFIETSSFLFVTLCRSIHFIDTSIILILNARYWTNDYLSEVLSPFCMLDIVQIIT